MNIHDLIYFISSNFFANICTLFSAIGTIGAVIMSLYLSKKNEKIKYKIITEYIFPIGYGIHNTDKYYSISLINLSRYLAIHIESMPYIRTHKMNLAIKYNIDWEEKNQLPKIINYGEKYTITIDKMIAKSILNDINTNKIIFTFTDVFGKNYEHKIKRKELEKFINF